MKWSETLSDPGDTWRACRRPHCCTRGDGRAHRAPAPRAPVRCAAGRACAGRRGRRLLRAGRAAARRALSGWAGWARARRRRLQMDVAAADGRQRRATSCALLALLNFTAARALRDAWVAAAEAQRAGRRGRRLAPAWRRGSGCVGRPGRSLSLPAAAASPAAAVLVAARKRRRPGRSQRPLLSRRGPCLRR
jgi:hypothetical protein